VNRQRNKEAIFISCPGRYINTYFGLVVLIFIFCN